ncbi:MAG: hypothetical protein QMD71_09050 [bacterium]|nr:hypothetical protein [bacterium]
MEITKSSRHQKIIGNFGENLICNWLSRSGFEVTLVDHTGIDIIAYNPSIKQRLGITVKSRTRNIGRERDSVTIFFHQRKKNDRQKLLDACKAFACEPWIAVYVETSEFADVYLTSLRNYDEKYRRGRGVNYDDWKMTKRDEEQYKKDSDVKHIRIEFHATNWWSLGHWR